MQANKQSSPIPRKKLKTTPNFDTSCLLDSLWHAIVNYLELPDVLEARLVCSEWNQGLTRGISSVQCVQFFSQRNLNPPDSLHLWSTTKTNEWPQQSKESSLLEQLQQLLTTNDRPFLSLLRTNRVIRHLPTLMAVEYNEEWGRYALPMQWNNETQSTEPIAYKNHVNVKGKARTYQHHPSLTNLPADLACPRCGAEETLLIGEFSYQSPPMQDNSNHNLLTLTLPFHQYPPDTAFPPPSYQDLALPVLTPEQPITRKLDSKHAITIHCLQCQQFALLAPAWHCAGPACRSSPTTTTPATTNCNWRAALLVRIQCSQPQCHRAVYCPDCARHPATTLSHCDACHLQYCLEHAWLSTVCHHW